MKHFIITKVDRAGNEVHCCKATLWNNYSKRWVCARTVIKNISEWNINALENKSNSKIFPYYLKTAYMYISHNLICSSFMLGSLIFFPNSFVWYNQFWLFQCMATYFPRSMENICKIFLSQTWGIHNIDIDRLAASCTHTLNMNQLN